MLRKLTALALLFATAGAAATNAHPDHPYFDDNALSLSVADIGILRKYQAEAFARMLASCEVGYESRDALIAADCDRTAQYFDIIYSGTKSALAKLVNASRIFFVVWRKQNTAEDEEFRQRWLKISDAWRTAIGQRLLELDR